MLVKIYENRSDDLRLQSSSGALFSELSEKIIGKGGIVVGASFANDWSVEHRCIDKIEDLRLLRKSKYVCSELGNSIKETENFLKEGRMVFFTGTPCQIAILKKYLKCNYDNLITAEVVCHGAPQKKTWNLYLSELLDSLHRNKQEIASIDFRDKSTGWAAYSFTISFKDGYIYSEPASVNLFMRLFLSDMIIKKGCFNCKFKQPNSMADITMGDFWGMQFLLPDKYNDKGTSLAIANTSKGEEYLVGLDIIGHFTLEEIAKYNPALVSSPSCPHDYDLFNTKLKNGHKIIILAKKKFAIPLYIRIRTNLSRIVYKLANGR